MKVLIRVVYMEPAVSPAADTCNSLSLHGRPSNRKSMFANTPASSEVDH